MLIKASTLQEYLLTKDIYFIGNKINKTATGLGLDEHADWLSGYLKAFEGTFIVVSHDYDFLEIISTRICDIEFATIKKYHGKYSEFLKQKIHLREDYIRQYQSQQKKIEKTEEYIRKNKAGANSKMARGRQKQLDRVERNAPPSFITAQTALTVSNLEVGYYYPLMPKLNFSVMGGQKVVITGFNGIGKSTLLKTLVKKQPSISGNFKFSEQTKIGYYEQDLIWENGTITPLQIIRNAFPGLNTKEIRHALGLALKSFKGSILLVSHEEKFYKYWIHKVINIEQLMGIMPA